jgi:two-component system sensor histidine kinase KdpD
LTKELSSTLDIKDLIGIGVEHIGKVFDSQVAIVLGNPDSKLANLSDAEKKEFVDLGIASWVYQNNQIAGLNTLTLPGAEELYLPLLGAQKNIGVLAVKPKDGDKIASSEQLLLLETFGHQIALACERALLSEESEQARVQVETEQLRSSLLSSVSHDLRTPLATISGAASSILEASDALDVQSCKDMVREIYKESKRLNRLVGNLLDMTRLESSTLKVKPEILPLEEIIGGALNTLEDRISNHLIRTDIPADLPLVSGDEVLIQQVMVNLSAHKLKFPPSTMVMS